jgi:hypothetical protein
MVYLYIINIDYVLHFIFQSQFQFMSYLSARLGYNSIFHI